MTEIQNRDIESFAESFAFSKQLTHTHILITGSTGLIGSTLVKCLLSLDNEIDMTIPVRNLQKAIDLFGKNKHLTIVQCDLEIFCYDLSERFDYIVHCASPTNGKYITEHPIETYELTISTTMSLLQYAKSNSVKGMVYVSSLEYYGENHDDKWITEDFMGYLDMSSPRSAYPMAKRSAEFLCTAFAKEHGVPVKIARLTQTFGAGVSIEDNRVFAQFARSIINGHNIILHTKGESAKPYCYTTDCIEAVLYILMLGIDGETYNVANQETYISIRDMASFLCKNFNPSCKVVIEEHPELGYAPVTKLHLSTEKLMKLGWKPRFDLREMFRRLIEDMKNEL